MPANSHEDPFLWLEDVDSEAALAWVRERNAQTLQQLEAAPEFTPLRARLLDILNSPQRIAQVSRRGDFFHNLWQDEAHPRGLWRRTTLADYAQPDPQWDTVLDLDALGAAEGENWVWGGAAGLAPDHHRCLIHLSRGGADAAVVREFDTVTRRFIADGFTLPEAKSDLSWIDADTVYVGTDFGLGSLTESGYPRVIKRWQRGTPLAAAVTVFEAQMSDIAAGVSVHRTPGHERTLFVRSIDFYERRHFLLEPDGALRLLDVPGDARIAFWNSAGGAADTLLMELRSPLVTPQHTHAAGTLLAADARDYLADEAAYRSGEPTDLGVDAKRAFSVLFEPTPTRSLASFDTTRDHLLLVVLDNVAGRIEEWRRSASGTFTHRCVAAPHPGTLSVAALHDPMRADDEFAEHYLLAYSDYLTPGSLALGRTGVDTRTPLKALPAQFDATGMHTQACAAISADGTRVPYFVVWPKGVDRTLPADGSTPTLLYGYGGFEISMQPSYPTAYGTGWLARGGVFVVANIRGGGEFGPTWHQAAVKQHKQRSYDDFIAVAQDLIHQRITSAEHLGIAGGSNGGLLVGAVFTQRPDLFKAVVCAVPLLDMRRYHKLLAGASWMAEYGDPERADEWAYIARYSPYQNLRIDATYPHLLFTTSTRDDRVHPGHARKMAARMLALGHDVQYFENIEGGHGGAADNAQRARQQALELTHLWQQLGAGSAGAAAAMASTSATATATATATAATTAATATAPALPAEAQAVLDFWFGVAGSAEHGATRAFWFRKSDATDATIARRFGALIESALRGDLAGWAVSARGALAQILLLDQFTRNVFRHTPRAFAGDAQARAGAQAMLAARQHEALLPVQRGFVYLPFEHAEDLPAQAESVRLFTQLAAVAPDTQGMLDYALQHHAVIARFGRFPHRNELLNRASTALELTFLAQPGSRF